MALGFLMAGAFPGTWPQTCLYPHTLSVLSYTLGLQSKPTLWMTSQPRNPLELRRGKLDSGKTQTKIRLVRVWRASFCRHQGPGQGAGDGDSKHALSTSWVPDLTPHPHSNPVGTLIIIPLLQMGKPRCREMTQTTQLENAVPGVKAS